MHRYSSALIALALLLAVPRADADESQLRVLRSLETPYYLVQTDLPEDELAPYLKILQSAHEKLEQRIGTNPYGKGFVLITDSKLRYDFVTRDMRSDVVENSTDLEAVATYIPATYSFVSLHRKDDREDSLATFVHELTHQYHHFVAGDDALYPENRLYSEGLAELVASDFSNRWDFGHHAIRKPSYVTNALRGFRGEPSLTVTKLGRGEFEFDQRTNNYFYDIGWSLCAFLDTQYPDRFRTYCHLIDSPDAVGLSMAKAWQQAFGDLDDKRLSDEIISWLNGLARDLPVAYANGDWEGDENEWVGRGKAAEDWYDRSYLVFRNLIPADGETITVRVTQTDGKTVGGAGVVVNATKLDDSFWVQVDQGGVVLSTRLRPSTQAGVFQMDTTGPMTGAGAPDDPSDYRLGIRRAGNVLVITVDGKPIMRQTNRNGMIGFYVFGTDAKFSVTRDGSPATRPAGG